MKEKREARVSPEVVWQAWEKAIIGGQSRFKHKIFNIMPGEGFSVLWKSFFVRLIFTYSVVPSRLGSEISHAVEIRGLFKMPVRFFLEKKIRRNLSFVLKEFIRQLEIKNSPYAKALNLD